MKIEVERQACEATIILRGDMFQIMIVQPRKKNGTYQMLKAYRASTHIGGNLSEIGLMYADPASRDKPDQSDNWTTLNVSADNRASYPRIITNSYVRPPDRNIGETRRAPGPQRQVLLHALRASERARVGHPRWDHHVQG